MFSNAINEGRVIAKVRAALNIHPVLFVCLGLALSLQFAGAPAAQAANAAQADMMGGRSEQEHGDSFPAESHPGVVFEEPVGGPLSEEAVSAPPEPSECNAPVSSEDDLPSIAIIIDDMGYHRQRGEELLELDLNLTFSFLPHAPFTDVQAERAHQLGRDILVHMPMEPRDPKWDPGEGALFIDDPEEVIDRKVRENLAAVPYAIGVNNHMGSRFTADSRAMQMVLTLLQEQDLFFVDSVTTSGSRGTVEARKLGIKSASRHVFLDNVQTREDICRQLRKLVAYAGKHGRAIGIGHPNQATINALQACREMLMKQVRIVGIREMVN